ncbi:helix-turn-helix transcriptional regulator [uncultured Paracoccus sp.]|uniref:helix-turn-helix transcriptional regulator n=1 Tax=uncultured Paracoccus sp. TaxID=189685 RepID=UPI0025FA5D10|nr:helix-turn-helix transcriptional regulator [uncultured Paracoccus sp.]
MIGYSTVPMFSMQPHPDDNHLVELIYAALLGESDWQAFLDRLAKPLPDGKAVLFAQGFGENPGFSALHVGMTDQAMADYGSHFAARNPWIPAMEATRPGKSVAAHRLCPLEHLARSEFYHDFLVPNDVETSGGLVIERTEDFQFNLTVMSSQTDWDKVDLWAAQFDRISPHLRRAADFYRRTSFANGLGDLDGSILDALHLGVVIVGSGCRIRTASAMAQQMFGATIGIDPSGRLRLGCATAQAMLSAMLSLGYDGPQQQRIVVGDLALTLIRMQRDRERSLFEGPGVCITLEPLRAKGWHADIDMFSARHRLTPAETRALDGLLSGKTIDQIAREAGRSRETIRSQLKTLYLKTGTTGQADLLRLVSGMRH